MVERTDARRPPHDDGPIVAAAVAVAAGARFGPTGVDALDVVFAFVFIVVVTKAVDGLGNVDGLATGIGAASAAGLFALAGFGGQDGLAAVALGLLAAASRSSRSTCGRRRCSSAGPDGSRSASRSPSARSRSTSCRRAARAPHPLMLAGVLLVDAAVVPSTGSAVVARSACTAPTTSCTAWSCSAGRPAKR